MAKSPKSSSGTKKIAQSIGNERSASKILKSASLFKDKENTEISTHSISKSVVKMDIDTTLLDKANELKNKNRVDVSFVRLVEKLCSMQTYEYQKEDKKRYQFLMRAANTLLDTITEMDEGGEYALLHLNTLMLNSIRTASLSKSDFANHIAEIIKDKQSYKVDKSI